MSLETKGLIFSIISAVFAILAGYTGTQVAKRDKKQQDQEKSDENKANLEGTVRLLDLESNAFVGELANLNNPRKKELIHQKIVKISELAFRELDNPELKKDSVIFSKWRRLYDDMQQHIFTATGGYESSQYDYQRVFDDVYASWHRFMFEGKALRISPNGDLEVIGDESLLK